MKKRYLSHTDVALACGEMATTILKHIQSPIRLYGVPRGGIPIAYMILGAIIDKQQEIDIRIVEKPEEANVFVDDLVDSGKTKEYYNTTFPLAFFFAAFSKENQDEWFVFPWEVTREEHDSSAEDIFVRLLEYIGEDPTREGLLETPKRAAKAYATWFSGYDKDPASILKVFEDGASDYDEMIAVCRIPFYSHCEHHIAMIIGEATVAYIPNPKEPRIVGLSKLNRLVDMFARRLQVQERLTTDIANALEEHLKPAGVGVYIKARHMCMESRGVQQQGHYTVTSKLTGVMKEQSSTRSEFMSMANPK